MFITYLDRRVLLKAAEKLIIPSSAQVQLTNSEFTK